MAPREIFPSDVELLGDAHVSGRQEEVLQSLRQLSLPDQQLFLGEDFKGNSWKLTFLDFHG